MSLFRTWLQELVSIPVFCCDGFVVRCHRVILLTVLIGFFLACLLVFFRGEHNTLRMVQCVFLLFISMFVVADLSRINFGVLGLPLSGLFGIFLMALGGVVSVIACLDVYSFLEFFHWIFIFFLIFFCVLRCDRFDLLFFVRLFLIFHLYFVFNSALNLCFATVLGDPLYPATIYSMGNNIRFFNQVQLLAIPLILFFLSGLKWRAFAIAILSAEFVLLFVGGARGAALCVSLLLCILFFLPRWRPQLYSLLIALGIAGVLCFILSVIQPNGSIDLAREGSSNRVNMWRAMFEHMSPRFILYGDGPASYPHFAGNYGAGHPHNIVMQMLFEWGGVAFLGFLLVFGGVVYKASKVKSVMADPLLFSVYISFSLNLVYALVDGVFVMPIPQTIMFVFCGFLLREICIADGGVVQVQPSGAGRYFLFGGLFLLVGGFYIAAMINQYSGQIEGIGPRFWAMGKSSEVSIFDILK